MALKIIGAGFGRTGTHSLKSALESLGFGPCHHMTEVRRSARQVDWWTDLARGGPADWDRIFADFAAQVDWPAACFWRELAAHYPQAKVILTLRDAEDWYASIARTILPASEIGRRDDPDPIGRAGSDIIHRLVLQGVFGGRLADRDHALAVYEHHRRSVTETIAAKRLLVYDVRTGWGPLCRFLGVALPRVPFPIGNTTDDFLARKPYLGGRDPG